MIRMDPIQMPQRTRAETLLVGGPGTWAVKISVTRVCVALCPFPCSNDRREAGTVLISVQRQADETQYSWTRLKAMRGDKGPRLPALGPPLTHSPEINQGCTETAVCWARRQKRFEFLDDHMNSDGNADASFFEGRKMAISQKARIWARVLALLPNSGVIMATSTTSHLFLGLA